MRTFIAIELPDAVNDALAALQDELRAVRADVSWTKRENFHLTLKFLGEVAEQQIDEVKQACAEAASTSPPFSLKLEGVGLLPPRQPRVIYLALQGQTAELQSLQQAVEKRMAALGFEQEARAFKPHITLGRIKSPSHLRDLVALGAKTQFATEAFSVQEIVLIRSELHPAGARYSPLRHAPLGG